MTSLQRLHKLHDIYLKHYDDVGHEIKTSQQAFNLIKKWNAINIGDAMYHEAKSRMCKFLNDVNKTGEL